jgi:hypothetical protein
LNDVEQMDGVPERWRKLRLESDVYGIYFEQDKDVCFTSGFEFGFGVSLLTGELL